MNGKYFGILAGFIGTLACALALGGCHGGKGKVVARIGSQTITMEDLDKELENIPGPYHAQFQNPQMKRRFLENLISQRLLSQEAIRRGLDKGPEIERQIQAFRMNLLSQRLIQEMRSKVSQPTDEDIKAYYTAHESEFKTPERVKVSHILVKTEKEAQHVLSLVKGHKMTFADAARKYSLDQGTKNTGGDIGYFTAGQSTPLSTVAMSLKAVGDLSGPVKSPEGYHILLLTEKQPAAVRDLEASKEQIRQMILRDKSANLIPQLIDDLKKKRKVVVYDDAFGAAAPGAEAPPGQMSPMPQMPPGHPSQMPPGHGPQMPPGHPSVPPPPPPSGK